MGPRQAVGSGRGRAGRGRECHLRPRTTLPPLLPISPSSSPGAHLPERPPPPPLQSPGRAASSGQARQAGALRRCAACFDSLLLPAASCSAGLPPVQARTGGEIGGINSSAPLPTFPCFAISTFVPLFLPSPFLTSHYVSIYCETKMNIGFSFYFPECFLYAVMSKYALTTKWM